MADEDVDDLRWMIQREDADTGCYMYAVRPKKEVDWWCDECLARNSGHHDPCCYCGRPRDDD